MCVQGAAEAALALQQEIVVLSSLHHPNIVRYIGSEMEENSISLFMEYEHGGSISSLLAKFTKFTEAVAAAYAKQVLAGLLYLHQRDIIHRDIKGGNILVGSRGVVKVSFQFFLLASLLYSAEDLLFLLC